MGTEDIRMKYPENQTIEKGPVKIQEMENDTRYVSTKLEESYKMADGSMLEIRGHEIHLNEQTAKNYKEANKSAKVKTSNKKAQKQMDATKERLQQLRQQGDMDSFILNGKIVQKSDIYSTNVSKYMEESMLTLEEATAKAEALKEEILKLEYISDELNGERIRLARELKKLYAEGMIEDEASTLAIEKKYGPLCEFILQENEYISSDKFSKTFTDFRKEAGRLQKKDGSMFDSEKKWDEQKRVEYGKHKGYYDYIALLEKVEIPKALKELGIEKGSDEAEAFADRFNLLKVYHLHRAWETNCKIDLVKWYNEERNEDGDEDFLSTEPIYTEERVNDTYPLF